MLGVGHLELDQAEARGVEEDLLNIREPISVEVELQFGAALAAPGDDRAKRGGGGGQEGRGQQQEGENKEAERLEAAWFFGPGVVLS